MRTAYVPTQNKQKTDFFTKEVKYDSTQKSYTAEQTEQPEVVVAVESLENKEALEQVEVPSLNLTFNSALTLVLNDKEFTTSVYEGMIYLAYQNISEAKVAVYYEGQLMYLQENSTLVSFNEEFYYYLMKMKDTMLTCIGFYFNDLDQNSVLKEKAKVAFGSNISNVDQFAE